LSDSRQNYNIFSVFIDHTYCPVLTSQTTDVHTKCTWGFMRISNSANVNEHVIESIIDAVRSRSILVIGEDRIQDRRSMTETSQCFHQTSTIPTLRNIDIPLFLCLFSWEHVVAFEYYHSQ